MDVLAGNKDVVVYLETNRVKRKRGGLEQKGRRIGYLVYEGCVKA